MTVKLLWPLALLFRAPPLNYLPTLPCAPPYTVYLQGGLTFESGKLGILLAVQELLGQEE